MLPKEFCGEAVFGRIRTKFNNALQNYKKEIAAQAKRNSNKSSSTSTSSTSTTTTTTTTTASEIPSAVASLDPAPALGKPKPGTSKGKSRKNSVKGKTPVNTGNFLHYKKINHNIFNRYTFYIGRMINPERDTDDDFVVPKKVRKKNTVNPLDEIHQKFRDHLIQMGITEDMMKDQV